MKTEKFLECIIGALDNFETPGFYVIDKSKPMELSGNTIIVTDCDGVKYKIVVEEVK